MPVSRAFRADSSRTSRAAAGWANKGKPCDDSAAVKRVKDAHFPRSFNWLRPRVLLESRNDFLAKLVEIADTDIVNDERMRWVVSQRDHGLVDDDVVIDARALGKDGRSFSFLAVGDPGEADISQYVVVPHLLAQEDTSFMVIVSDVIYPTGESNDYADAFYRAYRKYERPIYALPGNHDWYSLLTGFMWNIWRPAGALEYLGRDSRPDLTDPAATRPRSIGLRRAADGDDGLLYAGGTFV